jgi:hypothetical protein
MLILKAYINEREIEEIWIHNVGKRDGNVWEYRIRKPSGYDHIPVYHIRKNGWRELAQKVLEVLEQSNDD